MKNNDLIFYESPELRSPYLIAAFAGWPDAAQVATGAISYLTRKLKAKKFAELKVEGFYTFTSLRPEVTIDRGVVTSLKFPHNNFFCWQKEDSSHDLILFRGIEPDLHWQRYIDAMMELAIRLKVARVYTVGGLYDQIPHTREPRISGVVSEPRLTSLLTKHNIEPIAYQGPSSLHSVLLAACREKLIEALSLWGHAPFYVRVEANPTVCFGLLQKLAGLLEIEVDLEEIRQTSDSLQQTLDRLLAENEELRLYIRKLEEQYETEGIPPAPRESLEGADKIIKEVEEFLRDERRREDTTL